jgi:two-component system phosphate regulon sensor histidine kinase PhoR
VTRLRRLETLRRDFVANVSHELKTRSPPSRGSSKPCSTGRWRSRRCQRFLQIITRQADRLNAIIDDLLDLRIEQEAEKGHPASSGALRRARSRH